MVLCGIERSDSARLFEIHDSKIYRIVRELQVTVCISLIILYIPHIELNWKNQLIDIAYLDPNTDLLFLGKKLFRFEKYFWQFSLGSWMITFINSTDQG